MSRVLVIEDNSDLAFGLRNNLEIEGYEVHVSTDGTAGLAAARDTAADVIVLDLMLPETDGFRVLETLRKEGFDTPVLILTARGEEADKVLGFRLGADDYVTKPFGLLELLARVEALLRRAGKGRSMEVEHIGDVEVRRTARAVVKDGKVVELAPKELDLLLALLDREGTAVSRSELLEEVWGYSGSVVSRTVDTHIAELRRKLEDDPSNPRHILTVRKVGYRLER